MEGPLLLLKSWMLTALAIWVYQRWFQRVAPPAPAFEAFCAGRPVVGALWGLESGDEQRAAATLRRALGKRAIAVATLGGFPWPHYRLRLAIEQQRGAVLLRVVSAEVMRSRDRELPALAGALRSALNELPGGAAAWLHRGAFNNGLSEPPPGGWDLQRGDEKRPRFVARAELPDQRFEAQSAAPQPISAGHAARRASQRVGYAPSP